MKNVTRLLVQHHRMAERWQLKLACRSSLASGYILTNRLLGANYKIANGRVLRVESVCLYCGDVDEVDDDYKEG